MVDQDELDQERALTVLPAQRQVPAIGDWADEDKEALKQTVAKGCSDAQFRVFLVACMRLGLDPFARQIVPITQGGGMTPQVTIDGLRLIAERTGKYGGQLGPEWCGKDGVWHDVWLDDGPPAAARVAVIRRDFQQPMWGVARYKSYAKGGNWNTMPDVMIAKVAESVALRKAFPQELSGVYSDDEMEHANFEPAPAPVQVVQADTEDERTKRRGAEAMHLHGRSAPAGSMAGDSWQTVTDLMNELRLTEDERSDLFKRHQGKMQRRDIITELRKRIIAEATGREPEPAEASA